MRIVLRNLWACLVMISCLTHPVWAKANSRIHISCVLEKSQYIIGEVLEGEVVIRNDYPASIPSIFTMSLTHDGKEITHSQMSVDRLFTGKNTLSFRSFQIPQNPFTAHDVGTWAITINKLHQATENAAVCVFEVLPSTD